MRELAGLVCLIALTLPGSTFAQVGIGTTFMDKNCHNSKVDSVYQKKVSEGHFDYYAQVKNIDAKFEVLAEIEMMNFPADARIPQKIIRNIHVDPQVTETVKIGSGTNDKINNTTVIKRNGDTTGHSYTHVTIKNCKYTQVVAHQIDNSHRY